MEQLIELLKQIQELAGAGIDALQQAAGGGEGDKGAPAPGAPDKVPDGDEGGAPPQQ